MRSLEEQIGGKCVHYCGLHNKTQCDAGVVYDSVKDETRKGFGQYPCFLEGEPVPCDKRHFPTPEEVKAEVDAIHAQSAKTMQAMSAAMQDAKAKGFKKGNGGAGTVKCPNCESGTLHYSVASYNGHVWGKCSTPKCTSWMQ